MIVAAIVIILLSFAPIIYQNQVGIVTTAEAAAKAPTASTNKAANKTKYGVIIDVSDHIEVFDNLVVKSPKNNLMIKAKELCKELGFLCSYNSKTKKLTIKNDNNKLVFSLGSKQFVYEENGYTYKSTAAFPFYYDKESKCYLIHYSTLKHIISTEYFKVSGDDYFAEKGYRGMIYYKDGYIRGISSAETDEISDDVINEVITDDMSDFEKVLVINDYMVDNYVYDNDYDNYHAYDILKDKKGVCQAYAEAFQLFMDKLNIKCLFVSGEAGYGADVGGHAWNMVKLGGNYYHIDVTWNDGDYVNPISRTYGYFLLSDDQISELYHSWDRKAYPKCKKEIDRDIYSISYIIGDYFICSDFISSDGNPDIMTFFKVKYDGSNEKELFSCKIHFNPFSYNMDDIWLYYLSEDTGLSLNRVNLLTDEIENNIINSDLFSDCSKSIIAENNWIYFNNSNSIYRINVDTLEKQEIFNVDNDYISYIEEHLESIQLLLFTYDNKCVYDIDYEGKILEVRYFN